MRLFIARTIWLFLVDVADSFASGRTSMIRGDGLKLEIATVDRRRLTALNAGNG